MLSRLAALLIACGSQSAQASSESSLNCLTLFPTPDLGAVAGEVALLPSPSPFGVAVTVDGRPRHHLVATVSGLPDPKSLGPYRVYVAWGYTLSLDSAVKLGPITNGRVDLGELDLVQFRILVSAEGSSSVKARTGRLVLRGTSPSARLMAHRDVLQPSAPGALRDASTPAGVRMASGHEMTTTEAMSGAGRWSMPPMSPRLAAMPGMSGMIPNTAAFLPSGNAPDAKPRSTLRPRSGDTIVLESGVVTSTISGQPQRLFAYNGSVPGPLIDVTQGAMLSVRFRNALDAPGSIHWHGLRLDNPFDGAVGLTQAQIAPGDSFLYALRFPDPGIYWYHPHVREDLQQSLGLYGNLLVRSTDPAYFSPVNREEVLMLSDLLLGPDGATPFGADSPTHALMGRFGNVMLVNGSEHYRLDVKRGSVVRFYLSNASAARIYNLSFGGARMKLVGGEAGKFEREAFVPSVVIGPAERYVVDVEFARGGSVALVNRVQALDHMSGVYSPEIDTLGVVRVAPQRDSAGYTRQFAALRRNADVNAALAPFRREFDRPVDRELIFTLETRNLPAAISNMLIGINAPIEWNDGMPMMNWLTTGKEITWVLRDRATGKQNMDIDWRFRRGDVVKIRIFNDPSTSHAMAHPFHLHGQRFLVLTRDGVRSDNLVWKDTAIIPAGETVELLVDMSNPGRWMMHCHIAEHLSAGMMAAFVVE
jgi:FtsP/CotA-like multicopper oxidase with cupredoxin domain